MTTGTDTNEYYSDKTDEKDPKCIVKVVTIPGIKGKKIKIEGVALKLANEKAGIKTRVKVSIEFNGKETDFAAWFTTSSTYAVLKYDRYSYSAGSGNDVILRWYLTTENAKNKAMMKDEVYTYSLIDVEAPPESTKSSLVVIECASEDEAKTIADEIKKEYANAVIYIQS